MQQPPPYQHTASLPPHWQTRTDASGNLLYISPDGQTHTAPPTTVLGGSVREADGAISADLFGGDPVPLVAPPSYLAHPTPMGPPGVAQPFASLQPSLQTTLGMQPAVQPQAHLYPSPAVPDGVDSLMALGFGRDAATAALRECGGSVERAAHQLLAAQTPPSIAPTPASLVDSARAGLDQLMAMGYSWADANAALDHNQTLQAAADWLAQGYKAQPSSLPEGTALQSTGGSMQPTPVTIEHPALRVDEAQSDPDVVRLQEMGYSRGDAVAALTANGGDLQRAVDCLMSGGTAPGPAPAPVSAPLVAMRHDTLPTSSTVGGATLSRERPRRTSVDEIEKFFGGWGGTSGGDGGFDDEFDPRAEDDVPEATIAVADAAGSTLLHTVAPTSQWQWRSEGGWKDYTAANNAILERGYHSYQGNVRSSQHTRTCPCTSKQTEPQPHLLQ